MVGHRSLDPVILVRAQVWQPARASSTHVVCDRITKKMRFKPVTKRYEFDKEVLIKEYPPYLKVPIATWIKEVLFSAELWTVEMQSYRRDENIKSSFINSLEITFREQFPREPADFLPFVLSDSERTTNILGLCLQNYATKQQANSLENILSTGGSAYSSTLTMKDPQSYNKGVADITLRVPEILVEASKEVLNVENLLQEAWQKCYSRNPDYEKTVGKCVDALEGLFKRDYFPNDPKPNLTKFLKDFATTPSRLNYKGDNLVNPKSLLTDLSIEFIPIRGHHTSGTGKSPTKEEAEFVLHYSIFVFSVHRKN